MPKLRAATPEEIEIIKRHFEVHQNYSEISDELAAAQTPLLKYIRNGRYNQITGKLDE